MKLYAQLESAFKFRINSNSEIIPYIKKLAEMGKFDEPKKVAVLAIILDRLGKMEDEATIEESLKTDDINKIAEGISTPEIPAPVVPATSPDAPTEPETIKPVQTPVETTPEELTPVDDGTISEFTPENIVEKPQVKPEVVPVTPPLENAE